ncbi:isocitrate lyase/PEP mutase family protein [Desertihabitans brevis]|nr:isocitrate lyase/phosphoenolpyruvate mutase family protein [Desertihabitans brevis]
MTSPLDVFAALHDDLLVLPNAWDAASARLFERAGAPAVATSSSAVSWVHGVPDGNHLDADLALAAAARVVAAVRVPVTADIESGYADGPEQVAASVRRFADAGVVGINLEDARDGALVEEGRAAEAVAAAAGTGLWVNARTDVYLLGGTGEEAFAETVSRAAAYVAAGAGSVFVPGLLDLAVLARLTAAIAAPVNVLAAAGGPTAAQLRAAGVRRISVGNDVASLAYATAVASARDILEHGRFDSLAGGLDFGDMQTLWHAG